jgi:phage I-like protein
MADMLTYLRPAPEPTGEPRWIQAFPFGKWHNPDWGGDYEMTPEKAIRMVANFKNNVRGQDIPLNYYHGQDPAKGQKAAGWIRDMEVREDGLYILPDWTDTAKAELAASEWRYLSPEWYDEWAQPTTKQVICAY